MVVRNYRYATTVHVQGAARNDLAEGDGVTLILLLWAVISLALMAEIIRNPR